MFNYSHAFKSKKTETALFKQEEKVEWLMT